ncbi:MAG: proton-conducting transporter membrane subunit [Wenzhouxiangellaceae bacterium]|nr:proton-conducting transporter membrane subunit [Wenzhouxiangellaceae bacterium]
MLWLIPILPLLLSVLLYGWWRNAGRAALAVSAGLVSLAVVGLLVAAGLSDWSGAYRWSETLTLQLGLSGMGLIFALTVPAVAIPIVVYAAAHEQRQGLARLLALLTAFVGAMELLLLARDLLTLIIAWELVGAISWALIAHQGSDRRRVVHANWAFLVTRFGDLGLYIAAAAAYSRTGSFAYSELAQLDGASLHILVAGIVLACASKSAQLPFSPWLFAAMSGPTSASALLHSATMVPAGVYLIAQLHGELAEVAWFGPLALVLGLSTALAAGLVALAQPRAKRLLAASTSAQLGLMWIAVGAGYPMLAALHFVVHALAKAPLFLAVGVAAEQAGSGRFQRLRRHKVSTGLALASLVAALAIAGMFPLGGAWTKEAIVSAAGHFSVWVAILTLLAGGLSAAYAARLYFSVFDWTRWSHSAQLRLERAPVHGFAIASLATAVLWLPAFPAAWLDAAMPAFKAWELTASFALVVSGSVLGAWWARHPAAAFRSHLLINWFGIPAIAQSLCVAPIRVLSTRLARGDDAVVDAGVRWTSRLTTWLARHGRGAGEWLFDEIPQGLAGLSGTASRYVTGLQTGMVHHYYLMIAVGFLTVMIILAAGELF